MYMEEKNNAHPIGLIACSYEGALLCYKSICLEAAAIMGPHAHPTISMHNHSLRESMICIEQDDWKGVALLMLDSAKKLVATGAELIACPDNTIHQALELLDEPLPGKFLHIAEEVMKEAQRCGYKNLALMGTKYLMEGPVYKKASANAGLEVSIPLQADRIEINRIIFDELVHGIISPSSKQYLLRLIEQFKQQGCDAVILGCTEIPLIVLPEESSLPVLDSTRLLAKALVHASMKEL